MNHNHTLFVLDLDRRELIGCEPVALTPREAADTIAVHLLLVGASKRIAPGRPNTRGGLLQGVWDLETLRRSLPATVYEARAQVAQYELGHGLTALRVDRPNLTERN